MQVDLKFIEELKNKDDKAWEHVRKLCYSISYRYAQDKNITDDIVHDAIENIINNLHRFSPEKGKGSVDANFKNWIKRIVKNIYLNFRKKKQREMSEKEFEMAMGLKEGDSNGIDNCLSLDTCFAIDTNPLRNIAVKEVLDIFGEIKDIRKRTILILNIIYGHTTKEVADIRNENFDAVQTIMHRGRNELMDLFKRKGIDVNYLDPNEWKNIRYKRKI